MVAHRRAASTRACRLKAFSEADARLNDLQAEAVASAPGVCTPATHSLADLDLEGSVTTVVPSIYSIEAAKTPGVGGVYDR
jgi:hypothetical protein